MSWLDFSNHFLSNQRLHVWSWINRTFLGMVFFGGKFGSECFGLFLFLFLFSAGWESHQRTRFWLAIKGKGPLQVVVSLFGCAYSVLFGYLSGPKTLLYISSVFFWSLIENFIFFLCFLSIFDRELSSSFSFVFFRSLIRNFLFLFFWNMLATQQWVTLLS